MTTLREAAQQALEALKLSTPKTRRSDDDYTEQGWKEHNEAINALRAALAQQDEPVQEPVAWSHNFIRDNIITHRPADLERHPERWTALYSEPQPCPTCEALARTVMMDQTGHDLAPPQRKPLTDETLWEMWVESPSDVLRFARAIERAHGIEGQP